MQYNVRKINNMLTIVNMRDVDKSGTDKQGHTRKNRDKRGQFQDTQTRKSGKNKADLLGRLCFK